MTDSIVAGARCDTCGSDYEAVILNWYDAQHMLLKCMSCEAVFEFDTTI